MSESDTKNPSFKIVVDQVDAHSDRLSEMEEFIPSVHSDTEFMKGIIQKQDKQITSLQNELLAVKAKALSNYITVSSIEENGDDVDPMIDAEDFLTNKMKMTLQDGEVLTACRQGVRMGKKT